jgi:hypothetical protein
MSAASEVCQQLGTKKLMDQQQQQDRWGSECVEMYISFDMYYDRKEKKNVGTFIFVQLHIISQHCLRHFKSHDFSLKLHSCHNHKCCPTSDVSLPGKRISPIRGAVRERKYYSWEYPYFLWYEPIRFTCACPIARDAILRSSFGFASHHNSIHKNFLRPLFGLFSCPLPESYLAVSTRALFLVSSMVSTAFARSILVFFKVLQWLSPDFVRIIIILREPEWSTN